MLSPPFRAGRLPCSAAAAFASLRPSISHLCKRLLPGLGTTVQLGTRQLHALVPPPHLPPDGQQDGLALLPQTRAQVAVESLAAGMPACRSQPAVPLCEHHALCSHAAHYSVTHLAVERGLIVPELQQAAGVRPASRRIVPAASPRAALPAQHRALELAVQPHQLDSPAWRGALAASA